MHIIYEQLTMAQMAPVQYVISLHPTVTPNRSVSTRRGLEQPNGLPWSTNHHSHVSNNKPCFGSS